MSSKKNYNVAIVGASCILPKANSPSELWKLVINNIWTGTKIPRNRWNIELDSIISTSHPAYDKVFSLISCFIEDYPSISELAKITKLDEQFLASLDPLFHITLKTGIDCFTQTKSSHINKEKIQIILANIILPTDTTSDITWKIYGDAFRQILVENKQIISLKKIESFNINPYNRYSASLPASLLAHVISAYGGCFTIDAACASTLYAIKLACDELRSYKADLVLAGGVNRSSSLFTQMGFTQLRALSKTGICKPFDLESDGLVVGEGGGFFALKRLEDAINDNDTILGVIQAVGLSNDIGGSLLAPATEGQIRAMTAAYKQANWDPKWVDFIECHGTGTPAGDKTELETIHTLWKDYSQINRNSKCIIGSVKSNVGHLLTAAGVPALIKVLEAFKNRTLPPTANTTNFPPEISTDNSYFQILKSPQNWIPYTQTRKAAISGFGFGGINAHLLIEEYASLVHDVPNTTTSFPLNTNANSDSQNNIISCISSNTYSIQTNSHEIIQDVAIVGIGIITPLSNTLSEFQEIFFNNPNSKLNNTKTEFSINENCLHNTYRHPFVTDINYLHQGYFFKDLEIPIGKYKISPAEITSISPQQLIMLDCAYKAINDVRGNLPPSSKWGTFIGITLDLDSTNFFLRWRFGKDKNSWDEEILNFYNINTGENFKNSNNLSELLDQLCPPLTSDRTIGSLGSIVASRIAREFKIGSQSHTFSCEENSGIKALEIAKKALQNYDIDFAIVGAIDLFGDIRNLIIRNHLKPISKTSKCFPLSYSCDGFIPSEAAVAIVLKRLNDAIKDNDRIYCIIKGIGFSSGSFLNSNSYSTQLKKSLLKALYDAWVETKENPINAGILFVNSSGNPIDDECECKVITDFFNYNQNFINLPHNIPTHRKNLPRIALSAVHSLFGSTGAASGLLSVAAAALSIYQQIIPAFSSSNSLRNELLSNPIFYTPNKPQFWFRNKSETQRIAAVNSISIDGTCAHIVLQAHKDPDLQPMRLEDEINYFKKINYNPSIEYIERKFPTGKPKYNLFLISAKNLNEFITSLSNLQNLICKLPPHFSDNYTIANIWYNFYTDHSKITPISQTQINSTSENSNIIRCAIISSSLPDLNSKIGYLNSIIKSSNFDINCLYSNQNLELNSNLVFIKNDKNSIRGSIAFVFPGSGNHYLGMGTDIYHIFPEFLRKLDQTYKYLAEQFAIHLISPWRCNWDKNWEFEATQNLLKDHNSLVYAHVSLCSYLSDVLISFDITPEVIIGYSLGESAGYFASRTWINRDEMIERIRTSDLFTKELYGELQSAKKFWKLPIDANVDWMLGVVDKPAELILQKLKNYPYVYLLIINTYTECVIGGEKNQLLKFIKDIDANFYEIQGVSTVHCPVASPSAQKYRDLHYFSNTLPPQNIRFYSSGWGREYIPTPESAAESILTQALNTINLPQIIESAYNSNIRFFIEVGPRNSMSRMISKILANKSHFARSVLQPNINEYLSLLKLLSELYIEGIPINLQTIYNFKILQTSSLDTRKVNLESIIHQIQSENNISSLNTLTPNEKTIIVRICKKYFNEIRLNQSTSTNTIIKSNLKETQMQPLYNENSSSINNHLCMNNTSQGNNVPNSKSNTSKASTIENSLPSEILITNHSSPPINQEIKTTTIPNFCNALLYTNSNSFQNVNQKSLNQIYTNRSHINYTPYEPKFIDKHSFVYEFYKQSLSISNELVNSHTQYLNLCYNLISQQIHILSNLISSANTSTHHPQIHKTYKIQHYIPTNNLPQNNTHTTTESNQINFNFISHTSIVLDRKGSLEFATGSIAKSLGEYFASIDTHPTRVRLPAEPLNFVDRVLSIEGEKGSLKSGRIITQHDVLPNAWYLDHGKMPTGLSVEAGQADLMLSAWLGIDFITKGLALYRLLDATVTFHSSLPQPGDILTYDIRILRFIKQASTYLFFFEFDGYKNNDKLLTMRNGCAGFFTQQQLDEGKGLVLKSDDFKNSLNPFPSIKYIFAPIQNKRISLNKQQVMALRHNKFDIAFGNEFTYITNHSCSQDLISIPSGRLALIDNILDLSLEGGLYNLGYIIADFNIVPNAWFLTSHFIDDQVMPGTLMYEACLQTFRVFLLRIGWLANKYESSFEPIPGVKSSLRCRGQVTPKTKRVIYEIHIKEIGFKPEPYAMADALMYADGKCIVLCSNMSLKLSNCSYEKLLSIWNLDYTPLYSYNQILEFATGKPSICFGEKYKIYDDHSRFVARLPRPPYLFLDKITKCDHPQFHLKVGGTVQSQYIIPPNAWYIFANKQFSIPYSVLLEFALQTCGWFCAYMGASLTSTNSLHFRNLDGSATLFADVTNISGTLTCDVKCTKISSSAGMILLSFIFSVTNYNRLVFSGETSFGFFTSQALAQQVGLRNVKPYIPSEDEIKCHVQIDLPNNPPFTPFDKNISYNENLNSLQIPSKAYLMHDSIDLFIPNGGPYKLGYIKSSKIVNPSEWFFYAHFYQDPVMPGSLGLEAFIQLLKLYAIHRWSNLTTFPINSNNNISYAFLPVALNKKHTWSYRGQILPTNKKMTTEAVINFVDDSNLIVVASGYITVDNIVIYKIEDLSLEIKKIFFECFQK